MSPNISAFLAQFQSSMSSSLDSDSYIQSIFELDKNCNVVLQGRIGQVNIKQSNCICVHVAYTKYIYCFTPRDFMVRSTKEY